MTKKIIGIILIVVAAIVAFLMLRKKSNTPAAETTTEGGTNTDSTPITPPIDPAILNECATVPVWVKKWNDNLPTDTTAWTAVLPNALFTQPLRAKLRTAGNTNNGIRNQIATFFKAHDVEMSVQSVNAIGVPRFEAWFKTTYSETPLENTNIGFLRCK